MSSRVWTLFLAAVLAASLPVLARADEDILGNVPVPGDPQTPPDLVQITRADFGACATNRNFDELQGGGTICNGTHITNQYPGVTFSVPGGNCVICANNVLGGIIIHNSDPNVAFVQQNTNVCSANVPNAVATFSPPVLQVGFDYFTSSASNCTLRIYNAANQLLETLTLVGIPDGGFGLYGFIGLRAAGSIIARIEMQSRPTSDPNNFFNFSMDDFIYQVSDCATPTSAVSWGFLKSVYETD